MYLNGKTVFLAGSTGLAGTGILKYILDNHPAARVRAAYYKHTKPFIEHERLEYIFGDLKSGDDCRRMVEGCDCVIMAAASTAGALSITAEPMKQINDNLIMNAQMLEAFHSCGVKRVVYIGSVTLYQEREGYIREDELDLNQEPHPAYAGVGWVMRFLEKLCGFWHRRYGMEIVIARAANIFGPYDKFDPQKSHFIPAIVRKAVNRMEPFEIWGSPEVTRDVIYVDDFADAIIRMINDERIKFDIFNIGSGEKTTVGQALEWALKYAGHRPREIKYLSDKPTTIKFRALDCSKAREKLGWQPTHTVEEGIKKTVDWWIENKEWWIK